MIFTLKKNLGKDMYIKKKHFNKFETNLYKEKAFSIYCICKFNYTVNLMLITIGGMRQLKEYTKQCHALYQSLQKTKKKSG